MSTTAAAATVPAEPGWWARRSVNGHNEWLKVVAWSIPTSGAAEAVVVEAGNQTTGSLTGNLGSAITALYFNGDHPSI
jgi:hypothetical protein